MNLKRNQQSATFVASRLIIGVIIILFLNSCEKEKKDPELETTSITALSSSNYHVTAHISEKGDYKILDYGFEFMVGTSYENGYTNNNKISLGSTIERDTFSTTIKLSNYQYYGDQGLKVFAKAYITNEKGTLYAKEVFTEYMKLVVTQVSPGTARVGDTVTLYGKGFSIPASSNTVRFNSASATVVSATSGYVKVIVPSGISYNSWSYPITLYINSDGQTFQLENALKLAASATGFSPASGNWNTYITVTGSGLNNSSLYFDDVQVSTNNYSNDNISGSIPSTFTKKRFKIYVSSEGLKTEVPGGYFTMDEFVVDPLTMLKYVPGSMVTFTSNGYNPANIYNKLYLGSTVITTDNRNYSTLSYTIPSSMPEGNYPVSLSNGVDTAFTGQTISIVNPVITSITPNSGYYGTDIVIKGQNLYSGNQWTYLAFDNNTFAPISMSTETIRMTVPWLAAGSYSVSVYLGGFVLACPEKFTILDSRLTSINPVSGISGTSAIIYGDGFATKDIYITFGSLYATVIASTNNQINVKVPSGLTSGKYIVKVILNSYYEVPTTLVYTVP